MTERLIVKRSKLRGSVCIPPSKSQSLRAILFGLLGEGQTFIENLLESPDVEAMVGAAQVLGAHIEREGSNMTMVGVGGAIDGAEDVIDAGNSGIILRFVGALAGLSEKPIVITGDHSIRHNRPILPLIEALRQLGVEAESLRGDGGAPLLVRGPLSSGRVVMEGEDSQPVSGMLIAASFAPGPVEISVRNPGERPWIDLTLSWLERLGLEYEREGYTWFRLPGKGKIAGFHYSVPGDFSSLAFPLAAAVVTGSELVFEGLSFADAQGDKRFLAILQEMGAEILLDRKVTVRPGGKLRGISIDVNDCIDMVPILAVLGCFAEGETEIRGAAIARKKECDRLASITVELRKMGATIRERPDGLVVCRSPLKGSVVEGHNDHRIAMALAVAGLAAEGETEIVGTDCIAKTYPGFPAELRRLGASGV